MVHQVTQVDIQVSCKTRTTLPLRVTALIRFFGTSHNSAAVSSSIYLHRFDGYLRTRNLHSKFPHLTTLFMFNTLNLTLVPQPASWLVWQRILHWLSFDVWLNNFDFSLFQMTFVMQPTHMPRRICSKVFKDAPLYFIPWARRTNTVSECVLFRDIDDEK